MIIIDTIVVHNPKEPVYDTVIGVFHNGLNHFYMPLDEKTSYIFDLAEYQKKYSHENTAATFDIYTKSDDIAIKTCEYILKQLKTMKHAFYKIFYFEHLVRIVLLGPQAEHAEIMICMDDIYRGILPC